MDSYAEHEIAKRGYMDAIAEKYPDAAMAWIRGELASGKFLVLPPSFYDKAVPMLKKSGWTEKELSQLIRSSFVPAK